MFAVWAVRTFDRNCDSNKYQMATVQARETNIAPPEDK